MKLSLCMIVKDEEEVLARCLDSVYKLTDEIVIVDTGSSDRTAEIAAWYTDKVFSEPWRDDFSRARNFSFSKATGDYLLWLDADDILTEENARRLSVLKKRIEKEQPDTVMCRYDAGFLFERERILRRCDDAVWRGHVHECIPPFGKIIHDGFTVTHKKSERGRGFRNLFLYMKWAEKEPLSGRDLFYYGRELYYHKFTDEAAAVLTKMIEGDGWYVNKIEALKLLARIREDEGDREGALSALFSTFCYGTPRASVLCEIGRLLKESGKPKEAVYWYERAFGAEDHTEEGDFELPECRGILPALELVCLYHVLNDHAKSLEYHKKSEALAPDHPSVLYNRNYFKE